MECGTRSMTVMTYTALLVGKNSGFAVPAKSTRLRSATTMRIQVSAA